MTENKIMCCFCGHDLTWDEGIEITLRQNKEEEMERQTVYSHFKCIDERLDGSVPRYFKTQD
jgi:hypothetical protein